jgi:CHASE2 domain-containing sensor protein
MAALDILHTNRARTIIAETVLALILFFADPLGVVAYRAHSVDQSIAILTQFNHLSEAPAKLAVVLIDQDALDTWQVDWPLTYDRMAGLIHTLACAHVVGVFFDFTLSEKFNLSQGKDELEAAVRDPSEGVCEDGKHPAAISVFFGKAERIDSPLGQSLDRDGHTFSIDDDEDDSVYPAGTVEFPDSPVPIGQASPAFGIIRSVPELWPPNVEGAARACSVPDSRPKCWTKPLALEWGGTVDQNQGVVSDTICRGFPGVPDLLASTFGVTKEGRFEPCPPILTLKAHDLFRDRNYIAQHGNPAALLAGKFVFVGTDLAGLNDVVFSPVHGYLPGVYKHAVATDNLLSYMQDKADDPTAMKERAPYPTVPRPWLLGSLVVITYILIEAIREFTQGLAARPLILVLAALIVLATWSAMIYYWRWPWSLMLTVFGYYAGGVAILEAARFLSPRTKPAPRAQLDANP